MADPTLDATAMGASSNSYVTRAETQTYFDGRLNVASWTGASDADKDRALIMATGRLEQETWAGTVRTTTQALDWPRIGVLDAENLAYDQDVVPVPVKQATYETALELLDGTLILAPTGLEGFDSVAVGTIDVEPRHSQRAGTLSENVQRILLGIRTTPGGITARTVKT